MISQDKIILSISIQETIINAPKTYLDEKVVLEVGEVVLSDNGWT